jgi:transcriptional regulator with GAF, ATPase, and Fis domain
MGHLTTLPLKAAVQALETLRVKDALKQTRFHQKKAAALLGLTYDQFRGIKNRLDI